VIEKLFNIISGTANDLVDGVTVLLIGTQVLRIYPQMLASKKLVLSETLRQAAFLLLGNT